MLSSVVLRLLTARNAHVLHTLLRRPAIAFPALRRRRRADRRPALLRRRRSGRGLRHPGRPGRAPRARGRPRDGSAERQEGLSRRRAPRRPPGLRRGPPGLPRQGRGLRRSAGAPGARCVRGRLRRRPGRPAVLRAAGLSAAPADLGSLDLDARGGREVLLGCRDKAAAFADLLERRGSMRPRSPTSATTWSTCRCCAPRACPRPRPTPCRKSATTSTSCSTPAAAAAPPANSSTASSKPSAPSPEHWVRGSSDPPHGRSRGAA